MAVGESANFISYGLAAASVVAPLGTVGESVISITLMFRMETDLLLVRPKALIANCFISPLMLNERFGWRDAAGVILAALGAVTVVLSAKQQDREVCLSNLCRTIRLSSTIDDKYQQFDPDALMVALKQPTFIGYSIAVVVILCGLLVLTHTQRYQDRFVVVDVLM